MHRFFLLASGIALTFVASTARANPTTEEGARPPEPWKGFALSAPDYDATLKLRGLLQTGGIFASRGDEAQSSFEIRRARIALDGKVKKFSFRIQPEFSSSSAFLLDGYGAVSFFKELNLRIGKMKTPLGIEMNQSASALILPERGLTTALVPNRDIGAEVFGDIGEGILAYCLGAANGTCDGCRGDGNTNNDYDGYAKLFAQPFHRADIGPIENLGMGIAGSLGAEKGDADASGLGRYKTPGRQPLGGYADEVAADGLRWRLNPQMWWYFKSLGLLGEYVYSRHKVILDQTENIIKNHAWMVEATYVLTREHASYKGVQPSRAFGAFELAARYGELYLDEGAVRSGFFAAGTPDAARSWAVGLNYWTTTIIKAQLAFEQTRFATPNVPNPAPENAAFLRLQISL